MENYGVEHIAFILDGNRRFAKELVKKPWEGHKIGLKKTREVLEWSCDAGIKHMTAYALSLENLTSRPKTELRFVLKYFEDELNDVISGSHTVHDRKVKVIFIGRKNVLPDSIQEKIKTVEEITKDYDKHVLNIAVAYGGQQEIVDATKEIINKCMKGVLNPANLNEQVLKEHMYTNGQPYPNMIIRTGGEKRLSNFLPFQSVYSELIFSDKMWPELTKEDLDGFLEEYGKRNKKFGK